VAVIAVLGLIGWVADIPVLRTLGAAFPALQIPTALCLLIAAAALAAAQRGGARDVLRSRIGAGVIAVLAGATLLSEVAGTTLGLDFAFTGLARADNEIPHGMLSATSLSLLGVALGIALAPYRNALCDALNRAVAAAIIAGGFVSLVGLTFRVLVFYAAAPLLGLALPEAIAFVLLGLSLLAGRPDSWLVGVLADERPGAVVARWLLPASIAVPFIAALGRMLAERHGLVDEPLGAGLLTLVMIIALAALTLGIARELDRTDARRQGAEDDAQAQRKQMQVVLASIADGVIATDRAGAVRFMNAAAERFSGHAAAEAIGRPLAELLEVVDERTGAPVESPLEQAVRGLRTVTAGGEPALRGRGGVLHAVDLVAAPLLDPRGEVAGAALVLRDAAARREAEHAMREAYAELDRRVIERTAALERANAMVRERTRLLGAITASTPDLIFAKDRDGRMLLVNPAWLKATGKTEADVLGRQAIDFVRDPDDARRSAEEERRTIETGESSIVEETFSGTGRTYLVTKSPLRDAQSGIVGLIGVATDITERKRAERELQNLVVTEQRLREEAERANRAKDEFLAIVSHELRSPLNALRGWGYLLASTRPLDPALVERATGAIKRSVEHQARLIDDLLDTARIMSGKLTLEHRPLNLVEVVHAALDVVRPMAAAKQVDLRVASDHPVVTIEGDAGRMQQVVTNLLSNAIKFTPENGSVETTVRLAGDRVQLAVRDNGIGIAPEFLPHVFDRFTQADSSTTRRAGGLGIGLTLVRHLVELHGGGIRAESDGVGAGATFTLELPPPRATAWAADGVAAHGRHARADLALAGRRVFVVDDDADARETIGFALRHAGASVQSCARGAELAARVGETLAGGERPDVLLLDLAMPDEDGFAVLARVRAIEVAGGVAPDRWVPAIAVTAFTQFDRQRLAAAGFGELVAKPVDGERLVNAICGVIEGPARRDAPAGHGSALDAAPGSTLDAGPGSALEPSA
jgi:PAS domain S-box-containing protein